MSFWTAVANFFKDAKIAWETADALQKISYVFTAVTAVTGVKGFLQARNMQNKGQDILANKTAAGGKLPVIYGTRRVGAQIIYMDVSANDSRDLYVVYALSVGECDEILGRTIELDGNPLTDSARFRDGGYIGSDKISSGNYSLNSVSQNGTGINAGAGQFGSSPTSKYRYVMNLHHGQATQIADPMLVASMPNWTTAHKLNGVAYIAAHYGYDKEGIWSGVPQLTVQVRGKKVFDPRDTNQIFGTVSTYKYSDNPALTFLDYITNNEYGKGLTQSQINMSTFTAAANVCDTKVDQPYFNGTAQSLTWSGNIGDDFITIGGTDPNTNWWQNKVGEIIDVRDGSNTLVVDGKEIKDVQRNGFYDQNNEYIVYINDTLGSTYSSQAGTSLVKVKRFHCNGYLDANKNVMDNAKELLANMRGIFLYIDGKYELSIEDTGTATFNITDDHIISDAGISVDYGNKDKKANKVIVEFFNANKKYELDTATVLHDATPEYYSDDGDEILEIKAEFPYVTDPYIAYNMAKAILVRSRNQMTIQFLGTPEMYKLNVGDIVTLSYAGTFDTVQTCRVEALELQSNGLVSVSLIEYFDVYTWETPPEEPLEELANLPSAYAVKAPTGLSFTDSDSSATGRPFLSWDEPTDFPDYQYRVNVVDSSNNQVINRIVDVENCDLNFVPTGSYVANVTSLNTLGTESNPARFPTTGTFTIGDAPTATADIKDDAIVTDKILNNAVTDAKINSLTANKLTAGTIDASVITVTNLDADNITSGTIGADKIVVDDLSAINSDLGDIDAGSLNIGSGAFTVSTAGVISATSGEVGGFTLGSTSLTNTAADSKIQIGSGSDVFTVDGDGIYLGNTSFASAPFKALNTGEVQTTKSFTAGVAGSGEIAKMAGTGDYRFWSGNEAPANASFSVDKAGKVIAKNLVLKLTDGTVYFDSQSGFSDSALSQISLTTGTKVSTISNTFDADIEYEQITVTEDTDVNVSVSIDTNFGGSDSDFSYNPAVDGSENDIPDEFTLTIQHSSDGGSNYTNVLTDTFTRVNDRQNPKTTPAADEYKINTDTDILYLGGQGGIRILASTTTSLNLGCVDADGRTTLTTTGLTLTGISTGTTHRIKATVSTTDTSYDTTNNNVSSTAPRVISVTDPSGDGFYVGDGSGSTVAPAGDITRVQITTASNSGLTGGANFASGDALFSLALGSTFTGNKTFSNNVVIQGNLDVQGTTTTIDTTNLDVKDKNITLNYGTGDTSANANGAGFTIQDAVSAGNDASLTWTTANDTFNLSHPLSITGALTLNNTAISGVNQLAFNDPGVNEGIEWTGGNTKIFESPDNLTNAAGNLQVVWGGTRRLTVNNSGIDVNGVITIPATNNFEIDITGSLAGNIRANSDLFLLSQTGNLHLGAGGTNSQLSIATNGNATFTGTVTASGGNSTNWNTAYTYSQTDADVLRKRTDIPASANLNTYTAIGLYHQNSNANATSGSNYPANVAGMLTVKADGLMVYQTYQGYGVQSTYERKYYNGTWYAWAEVGAGTTINNNADNRIITGSGTANTLNAESGLTYNGSALAVTGTITSGAITSSGNLHAGDGTNISMDSSANGQLEVDGNGYQGAIALDGSAMHIYQNSASRNLVLGTNETARLTISGTGGFNFESNPVQGITTLSSGSITVDKANGTGAVVGMQLLSGSSQGDSIAINFGSTTANEYSLLYDHYTNRLNLTDGGSNVFYVAGGVVNFSSAPVFGGGLTVPSLSVTGNGTIQTGAAGLIKGGYYQVGSTTVIDTSRNLTNIGTIQNGSVWISDGTNYNNYNENIRLFNPANNVSVIAFSATGTGGVPASSILGFSDRFETRLGNTWRTRVYSSGLYVNGGYYVGTTGVIDASRNLTNIANISATGTGTTPFTFTGTSSSLVLKIGSATQTSYASTLWETNDGYSQIWKTGSTYTAWGGADALNIYNSNGNISFHPSATQSVLQLTSTAINATKPIQISGTTVIDTSRNLTNIGTISSGAITAPSLNSTGTVTINSTGSGATLTVNRVSGQPNIKAGTDDGAYLIMDSSGGYLGLNWYSSDNIVIGLGGGNTGIGIIPSGYKLHVNGTIGSGAITSSGTSNFERFRLTDTSKMGFGTVMAGASIGHTASVDEGIFWHQTSDYGIYRTAGAWSGNYQQLKIKWHTGIEIDGNGTVYGKSGINFLNGNIKMDGTQILDAARNLSNIGTISSGAITSSGKVIATQLDLVGTDVYIAYGTAGTAPGNGDYLRLRDVATGNDALQFYMDGVKLFSIDGQTGNAYHKGTISSGAITSSGDVIVGESGATAYNTNANGVLYFGDDDLNDHLAYSIGTKRKENIGGDYTKLNIDWHTGITLGASSTYGGVRFFNNSVGHYNSTTKLFSVGESSSDVKVYNDLQVDAGIKLGSSATRLSQSGVQLKVQTTSGYCEIGPANTSWMHFETDRARFYFNTLITVDSGIVQSYDEDLILRRAQNSSHQLTIGTSGITASGTVTAVSYGAPSGNTAIYRGYNGSEMVTGVNGAAYYHGSDGGGYGIVIQGGHPICKSVKIGSVNAGTTVIDASRNGVFERLRADGGNLIMGNEAYSNSNSYVGMKTSLQSGSNDYMILSGLSDGATYVSAKDGSEVNIRGGGNNSSNQIVVPDGTTITATTSNFRVTGNVTAYASDKRLKTNIKTIKNPIEKIKKIRGVEFDWLENIENFNPKYKHETGVIAQEIEEVIPDAVSPAPFNEEYKTVDKEKIVALLIEAIKDQQKQIDELKQRLDNDSSD